MAAAGIYDRSSTSSSGASTPALNNSLSNSGSWSHAVAGLLRRFSSEPTQTNSTRSSMHSQTFPVAAKKKAIDAATYTPPYRTASPFQPPPLYPILLKGYHPDTAPSAQLLSKAIAEEIRLLVPPRLQLCEEWNLVYSLEQDGVSLGTLYKKCEPLHGLRNGYVLIVKDGDGGLFGAYLTEAPRPFPHYYGTGECFLWRATFLSPSSLAHLPLPPSADTTNVAARSTTIGSSPIVFPSSASTSSNSLAPPPTPSSGSGSGPGSGSGASEQLGIPSPSPSTPTERIRFKAFPYSGVNDYMILSETGFLSVGGGDGHFGLWLDDSFEKGVSSSCPTFGNEPLSEEGEKFDIIGVELWTIGNLTTTSSS